MELPSSTQQLELNRSEGAASTEAEVHMDDFYRLQQRLLLVTVTFSAIAFLSVWLAYSLHIALNYLIGACTGVVYLRMLSKNVEKLGQSSGGIAGGRLALIAALILTASQWEQLEIMPAFLGFLTYKAALIGYTLWTAIPQE